VDNLRDHTRYSWLTPSHSKPHCTQPASSALDSPSVFYTALEDDLHEAIHKLIMSTSGVTEMDKVRQFFGPMTDSAILEYGLSTNKPGAPDLAKHTIVVVVNAEEFAHEPRCLTEYGLQTFTRRDMQSSITRPGAYGEKLLRNMWYYHVRLLDNAHYVNRTFAAANPEPNLFGNTTFTTMQEAKNFLTECLSWPIDSSNPKSGLCPVILLGHAVQNEERMFRTKLGISSTAFDNVVATIDTQTIANENSIHGPGDKIGLKVLVQAFNLEHRNPHTASNDAAHTIVCAVQMVMSGKLPNIPGRSLQAVVNGSERHSWSTTAMVGIPGYCTKCDSTVHRRPKCF
jgi:hypothetical protein